MTDATGDLVLIVEDETPMRRVLVQALTAQGYRVVEAGTLAAAHAQAVQHRPAAILLDLGLPDGDGLALIARVRAWTSAPIVVVSAREREGDKVAALDAGADDYLTKPFGTAELLARLRVALRHARAAQPDRDDPVLQVGPFAIDRARHEVARDGTPIHLTPLEFELLAYLARHAGKVLTHRQLLLAVWGPSNAQHTHYLRVHVAALRRKLEADPARPRYLITEPGVGYRLCD